MRRKKIKMQLRQILNDETCEYRIVSEALLDGSYLLEEERSDPLWIYFHVEDGIMSPSLYDENEKQIFVTSKNEEYISNLLKKAYGSILRTEWLQPTPKQIEEGFSGYIFIYDDVLNDVENALE